MNGHGLYEGDIVRWSGRDWLIERIDGRAVELVGVEVGDDRSVSLESGRGARADMGEVQWTGLSLEPPE